MFDSDFDLLIDLGRSYKYFYSIHRIKLYRNRPQVHLNRSITNKGGRFSDIGIFLMSKKGLAQKSPPPPTQRVELKIFIGDTRDLILQIGEKICLPSRSSRFGHILTKMPWTTLLFAGRTLFCQINAPVLYNSFHSAIPSQKICYRPNLFFFIRFFILKDLGIPN